MKLSTKFSEGKTDEDEDEDFDSVDIKGVNHLLRSFMIYSSILFWTVPLGIQSPLTAAFLAYVDWLFGYLMVYTLDSIKKFYQVYHNTRIHTGVTDPAGSARCEQALIDCHLRIKEQIPATRQPTKETMAQVSRERQVCFTAIGASGNWYNILIPHTMEPRSSLSPILSPVAFLS